MTPQEAVTQALVLAATAPTDAMADEVVKMAEAIIASTPLSEIDVARAKKDAIAILAER